MNAKQKQQFDEHDEMTQLMDHCDCGSDDTNCINSANASQFSDAWYEMQCAVCGAVWTVYDRSKS